MIYFILGMINEPIYSLLINLFNKIKLIVTPEKVEQYGDLNPSVTFYIINNLPGGLASQYDAALGYIDRAIRKGYIPIIDLRKTDNDCLRDKNKEESNPWNYFFEQPFNSQISPNYSLEDIYKSSRVVHCNSLHMIYKRVNKRNIQKRFLLSQYVRINEPQYEYITELYKEVINNIKEDIIGVYYRGTDYKTVGDWKPVGHARVPQIERFCDSLENDMKKWNCKSLFFMTEEQEALDYFLQRFPEARYVRKQRFSNFSYGQTIAEQVPANSSRFQNNLLYLADIFILSRCQYLVGTVNSGVLMAMNWNNNKYKDFDILSYGITR